MSIIRCGSACATAIALFATAALAQTAEEITWCTGSSPSIEKKILGCTAMIKSREYRGDKLAIIYNSRGIAYATKGDYDNAIADYNQAIVHDISNGDTFYNRGLSYRRKGDYDHAINDFTRAISGYDPSRHPLVYFRDYYKARGDAYRGKKDFPHAIADYDDAIKIDPSFARAIYNRGEAKQLAGDRAGGDADIARAKELQDDIGPEG
jgi:tetratricopeptide (TPR) repeat protein